MNKTVFVLRIEYRNIHVDDVAYVHDDYIYDSFYKALWESIEHKFEAFGLDKNAVIYEIEMNSNKVISKQPVYLYNSYTVTDDDFYGDYDDSDVLPLPDEVQRARTWERLERIEKEMTRELTDAQISEVLYYRDRDWLSRPKGQNSFIDL
jgi:hypothetical protein